MKCFRSLPCPDTQDYVVNRAGRFAKRSIPFTLCLRSLLTVSTVSLVEWTREWLLEQVAQETQLCLRWSWSFWLVFLHPGQSQGTTCDRVAPSDKREGNWPRKTKGEPTTYLLFWFGPLLRFGATRYNPRNSLLEALWQSPRYQKKPGWIHHSGNPKSNSSETKTLWADTGRTPCTCCFLAVLKVPSCLRQ